MADMEEMETAIKVIVVGNGAVGKSSMIQRYCKGIFTRDYKKTIGVDFLERQIEVDGEDIRLMLWDTAGQEEFDAITKAYYRGAQVCVIAYSLVDRESFLAVEEWKRKVEAEVGEITTVLVQNKIDLPDEAALSTEEAEYQARKLNLKLFTTSVKNNQHVDEVFSHLAKEYLSQVHSTTDCAPTPQKIGSSGLLSTPKSKNKSSMKSDNGTIVLHPSRRRTNGKKKLQLRCTIL